MIQLVQVHGTDKQLYQLVAPLVMNPEVIKQNYNFPFRTSELFEWFIAIDNKTVVGFLPVEYKKKECIINNYYIKGKQEDTLKLLLKQTVAAVGNEQNLTAVCFLEDKPIFEEQGFSEEKRWTRYAKLKKNKQP